MLRQPLAAPITTCPATIVPSPSPKESIIGVAAILSIHPSKISPNVQPTSVASIQVPCRRTPASNNMRLWTPPTLRPRRIPIKIWIDVAFQDGNHGLVTLELRNPTKKPVAHPHDHLCANWMGKPSLGIVVTKRFYP